MYSNIQILVKSITHNHTSQLLPNHPPISTPPLVIPVQLPLFHLFLPPHPSYYPFLSHDINTKATTQVHTLFNCSLFNFPSTFLARHIPTKLIEDVLIHLLLLSYESSTPASERVSEQWTWTSPDW